MLADLVREHRRRVGLTQDELADHCGVAVRTIRGIEAGHIVRPRPTTARVLADVFALTGEDRAQFLRTALEGAPSDDRGAGVAEDRRPVPAQLPADVPAFTGRDDELATLDALVALNPATTAVISAVSGTAGVGKTALAVRWGHRAAGRFPDGQLYVNLRGYDPDRPVTPAKALGRLLEALGVRGGDIPVDLDACAAAYRTRLAGRRMLVLLDNAANVDQVRPLLPGSPSCTVVVTSRDRMTGLVARDGAHRVDLDLLPRSDAIALLRRLIGDRVDAEPDAAATLADLCARLPLALRIAAELASARAGTSITDLATELADQQRRLNLLNADGDSLTDVTAVFSWSLRHLSAGAANLFRLLGLHPGPDIGLHAAASLAGATPTTVQPWLAELTQAHLLTEHAPDRYMFHDLLRAYAADLTRRVDDESTHRAALTRMLDHYTLTAHSAARFLNPLRDPIVHPVNGPSPATTVEQFSNYQEAMSWLTAEHAVLMAALRRAAAVGLDAHAWQLAWSLAPAQGRLGYWHERISAWQIALEAVRRLGHLDAQALVHRDLASATAELGLHEDAHRHLQHTLELATLLCDQTLQANAHRTTALLHLKQGQPRPALASCHRALDLYRAAGHQLGMAGTLNCVGWCHAELGDHTRALEYCEEALALQRNIGDRKGEAATWDSLGYANQHLGHHGRAADCYHRAIDLYRQLGDRYNQADSLTHLGDAHRAAGDIDAGRTAWSRALEILEDVAHPDASGVRAKLDGVADGVR